MDGIEAEPTASTAKSGALQGIRIIDLSRVLGGPYCTQALADHGADVIKLEPPLGDETRAWGPPFDVNDTAWYFDGVNRNKRGICVDLSTDDGRQILWRLLDGADVLIENFKPGTLARWGMDFHRDLSPRFPRLIHCAVTGFGADGPLGGLPGYDAAIQAMAGLMSVNGEHDGGPMRVGLPIVDMVTGLNAMAGILLALTERAKSDLGQSIDVALYDSGVALLHPHLPNYFGNGKVPQRSGNAHPNIAPYDSYATGDTPIFLAVGNDRQFAKLCSHIGIPEAGDDPRFSSNRGRCEHRAALRETLEERLVGFHCEALAEELITLGVPCGPVRTVDQVAAHPHTAHRGLIVSIGPDYRGTGSPIKLSRTPASYRSPPPRIGADTDAVLAELGFDEEARNKLHGSGVLGR